MFLKHWKARLTWGGKELIKVKGDLDDTKLTSLCLTKQGHCCCAVIRKPCWKGTGCIKCDSLKENSTAFQARSAVSSYKS